MKNVMKTILLAAGLVVAASTGNAAMVKSYDFDNGFGDTLGNGSDLISLGGGITGGQYFFGPNQGLRLEDALPSLTDYAIEMRFQVNDNVAGYNKLVDFQDLASDNGLYVHNNLLGVYSYAPRGGFVTAGQMVDLGFSRSGSLLDIFLNGTLALSLLDTGNFTVAGANVLNFFVDDFATSQGEAFFGSVDFIRIHEDSTSFGQAPLAPVPLPAALPLLLTGLAGMGLLARRRKG